MVSYKQLCARCKKNFVLVSRNQFPLCYDCQKRELSGEVKDPKMKKLFNIPDELYKQNSFLREIKLKYLKFGSLSEKQIEVFARVAKELQEGKEQKQEPTSAPAVAAEPSSPPVRTRKRAGLASRAAK